jgi:hypothetical protein
MTRLFPTDPPTRDAGAERVVWEALRNQLPDDAVLFAGVGLQDDEVEREIDLLVAWPGVGMAVLEVKGGYVTRDGDGWLQGNASLRHQIDPVYQVQQTRHVFTRLLRRHKLSAADARIVHLVALPQTAVPPDWDSADLPRAMVLDRNDLGSAAGRVKQAIDRHGVGRAPLTESAVEPLVQFLAGSFPSHLEVLTLAAQHEDRAEQLTRDQARLLDALCHHNRLQIIGGAGTGKTWLALEQARRRAAAGERVALLCYSRGLGRYLERITATWPLRQRPAFVGLFHELPVLWGAAPGDENDPDDWERRLPTELGELAAARQPADLFDSVVVDEAQDFGAPWWPSLLRCLRDPDHGGLFVFMDESQHVFARDGAAPIDLPPFELGENLRSTKQIAQLFGAFGDTPLNARGLPGSPVRVVDVPYDDAIAAADDAVESLLEEGWEPGQIALLATGARHPEQRNAVDHGGYAAYWDDFFASTDVFYGHVLGFKGLERTVVVLAVNGFRERELARRMLYTGLSRARVLLVVAGPRAEIERLGGDAVRHRLHDADNWTPGG